MAVQYSIQKMVSDGTLSTIALGIQYLQRNDIYIRIAGEETPQSGAPSGYTWSFLDNTTLKILPVVPNGVEVVVYRRTDVDAMYNIYSQNAQFDEATIDENNQQLLYIAQEYLEQGLPGTGIDTIEYVRDDGSFTYYRLRRTDGSYSEEFTVPSASNSTKVLTRESLRRSYAEAGYNLVDGSFEAGGTLTNAKDVLLQESTGKAFSGPAGVVAAGTNPASGGFVDVSGELLRSRAVGVDAGTSASLQVMTERGSVMFTEVSGPATTGDLVIGGVVYRLTASNVESSSSLSDEMKDGGCGWHQLRTAEETALKGRNAPLQITSDDVATNGTMKAWRLAEGICDSATAGSFMTGYESEPDSQVIGFTGFDKIGSYQARDSVALFSQVQGQAVTCLGPFSYTATTVTGPEIQAQWDKIKVGMILDTNLGNTGTFKGAVVIGKIDPFTLQVSPWVDAAGNTVSPPPNGTNGAINQRTHLWGLNSNAIVNNGAVQGIGAEIGMMCITPGSGTNSKVIYAVNLSGESPEFGFYAKGPFRKGYTVVSVEEFAFYSKGVAPNGSHFRAESASGDLEYEYGPNGLKYEAVDYALAYASGQLTTRPITLSVADNLVMSMPPLKAGRRLAYKNFSGTPHTVNGITLASGSYTEFLCDGSSWLRLFTV